MKGLLIAIMAVALLSGPVLAEKVAYAPTAAADALNVACQQAQKESKLVFIKSGTPECGWCNIFDRYHEIPGVKAILGKYYVIVAIDVENMPDGNAVFSKYAAPASPSWVIITPDRKAVIDSYAPTGNVGYPLEPQETAYYLKALKTATPALTQQEMDALSVLVKKAANR